MRRICVYWACVIIAILCPAFLLGETADVYLFAGQSNMWGTGTRASNLPAELTGIQSDIMIYKSGLTTRKEGWYPLENGVNNNDVGENWGAEAQLTHDLLSITENKPIYILKFSMGGSALAKKDHERDWNVDSRGELLDGFVAGIIKLKANLAAEGKTPRFRGFIWMQGEAECCHYQSEADHYQKELEALIAKVREAAGTPDLPVYIGRIHRHYRQPFLQTVRANQGRTAADGTNIFMFDTDTCALMGDSIHFAEAGHVANGKAIFELITGKAKRSASVIAPGQTFAIREFAGPGTPVGTIALTARGTPTPTYAVEGQAFEVNGETGLIKVRDLSTLRYAEGPFKLPVSAINGVAPTGSNTVTITFTPCDEKDPIANLCGVFDPDSSEGRTLVSEAYQALSGGPDGNIRYSAADAAKRPLRGRFPGTDKSCLEFDGKRIMMGPASNEILTPGVDEDLTLAMAIHIPAHSLTSAGWCAMINKSVEPALGIGFDYAANKFFFVYSNPMNGTVHRISASTAIQPGTSHIVRLRKVGETCRLYIDGVLAGENKGGARPAILAKGQGAAIGLGGAFPPSPSFTGCIGKFYVIKGIPTTREEDHVENDLAVWAGLVMKRDAK